MSLNELYIFILAEKYIGTKAIATGWGTLKEDGKPSCILQEVEVPILDNNVCVENTNYTQKMITDNMMCAGYPGIGQKDSCQVSSVKAKPIIRQCISKYCITVYYSHILLFIFWHRVILVVHLLRNVKVTNYTNWWESYHGVIYKLDKLKYK